jgi:DNA mismatch repair ATPase MutS
LEQPGIPVVIGARRKRRETRYARQVKPSLFEQHARLKSQYPSVILLLRVGDFYEAFDDDADTIARVLSLALTARAGHRMAGFPHMQLDRFLTALVGAGFRVATAEPVFDKLPADKPEAIPWTPRAEEAR